MMTYEEIQKIADEYVIRNNFGSLLISSIFSRSSNTVENYVFNILAIGLVYRFGGPETKKIVLESPSTKRLLEEASEVMPGISVILFDILSNSDTSEYHEIAKHIVEMIFDVALNFEYQQPEEDVRDAVEDSVSISGADIDWLQEQLGDINFGGLDG